MKNFKIILVLILVISSIGSKVSGEMLNGAGATFPYPLYAAWANEYHKATGIKINYQSIGSGGGVRQIISRTVDFGASDDALKPEEIEKNGLLQWPQVIGGIVLAFNVQNVKSESLVLDSETVCKVFMGDIKYWDDMSIVNLNKSISLPHKEITVVYRSDGSGTTAVFTHYLAESCKSWKDNIGEGKSVNWKVGLGAKGNEGVANYVKRTEFSIGYMEYAYAKQNNISYTLLKNPAGNIVKPGLESFAEAATKGNYDPTKHFYTWITNVKGPNAWPITAATNILVAKDKKEAAKKVVKFFDWAFSKNGDEMAKGLIYAPLPTSLKNDIKKYWKDNGIY